MNERGGRSPDGFTPIQKEALINNGFAIYRLTGQTLELLFSQGHPFVRQWHDKDFWFLADDIAKQRAIVGEVAIRSELPFLSEGTNKTLDEQLQIIDDFNRKLKITNPGVIAMIGNAPDYAELAFQHPNSLCPINLTEDFIRTKSFYSKVNAVTVGPFLKDGLNISGWNVQSTGLRLGIIPLLIPE
jgi:hypothetical protein